MQNLTLDPSDVVVHLAESGKLYSYLVKLDINVYMLTNG